MSCLLSPIFTEFLFFGLSLSFVSSVLYPLTHFSPFQWFNVQLKLSKAINTRFVMKRAELR